MREYVEIAVSTTAVVALASNLRMIRRSGALQRDPAGWLSVVLVVMGGLLYEAGFIPTGQPTQLAFFGLLLGCLLLAASQTTRNVQRHLHPFEMAVFMPAGIATVMFISNAFMNIDLPLERSFGRLLAVAILVILAVIVVLGQLTLADMCRIVVSSVLLMLVISPINMENWRQCDIFKCGPFDAIYTGPFSSENALAIFCCVAALCVAYLWSKTNGVLSLLPIFLILYATESRTSQLALVCAFAAWFSSRAWSLWAIWRPRKPKMEPYKEISDLQVFMFSTLNLGIFVVGFLLILTAEPASFSNRGNIWLRAVGALEGSWVSGLGLDRWTYLQAIGLLPPLFPHSQYLLVLFGGGIVTVLLMFGFFAAAIAKSSESSGLFFFAIGYTVFLAILGLTEVYWNPIAFDGHTMLVLPLMFLVLKRFPEDTLVTSQVGIAGKERVSKTGPSQLSLVGRFGRDGGVRQCVPR
jgi:hypothetical protein